MSMRMKAALASAAVVAAVLGYASVSPAASEERPAAAPAATGADAVAPQTLVACRGGAQEEVQVLTNDVPVNLPVNAGWAPLPGGGGQVNQAVPLNDSDLFVVDFSSVSKLNNASAGDRLDIRVLVTGVEMAPAGGNVFVETTKDRVQNAGNWCRRVGSANPHTVQVQYRVVDVAPLGAWATVDNTALHLEVSN